VGFANLGVYSAKISPGLRQERAFNNSRVSYILRPGKAITIVWTR